MTTRPPNIHGSTPENFLREELFDLISDPEFQNNLADNQEVSSILLECGLRCEFILSTTPPAQTSWAPLTSPETEIRAAAAREKTSKTPTCP